MNLSFDSIGDLEDFLHWADKYSRGEEVTLRIPALNLPKIDGNLLDTSGVAFDTPPVTCAATGAECAGKVPAAEPVNAVGKPARKRRTKAEIEADEKRIAEDALARQVADGNRKEFAEEVAAVYAKGDEKAAEPAAQPEGTNPFEQAATPAAEAASPAAEPAGAEAAEDTVVTPFQHLTRAREFIGKHGMLKYNESFAKAGLDPNVMAYTGYQRALHIDALDALEHPAAA